MSRQKVLMCAPDYFAINYVINPWMEGNRGKSEHNLAIRQWNDLRNKLSAHADLAFVTPQPGLPDQVFTANAAFVLGNRAVISRFRSTERQGEEPFFRSWFEDNGFDVLPWPKNVFFEGAGDALLDRGQPVIWAGYGFRSDKGAAALLERGFQRQTISLHLVNPRFYHLDTCLCPLEGGYLMYFPGAFDQASLDAIASVVPREKHIEVMPEDAHQFACNTVDLDGHVFLNDASEGLQAQLRQAGFTPVLTPLSEFMKSGGAAKCLTLKLVEK